MTRLELPLTILLNRELKSLNAVRGRHWSVKNADRNAWRKELHAALTEHANRYWIPPASQDLPKRRAVITRILGKGQRRFDFDNLVGGCKPLIDAGKKLGLWRDDSPEWLEVEYFQDPHRRSKGPAVQLTIEET